MTGKYLEIKGLDQFQASIRLLEPKLKEVFYKLGNEYANVMMSTMRSVVPVRTGFLRSTIGKSTTSTDITVYVYAYYAGYVNFGTYKMKARPYFTDTAKEFTAEFEKAFDAATGKALST